ncbi:UV DNA damage repair endonuclease UvsE [Peribacillus alkalitolerans]|uniref:UV DNA damage repair endonuclease UvsE n=1 Tax=Peribacillus alkalitolerans TaxID=1550385 RepID=UPI0013D8A308|nr:UV DNA damage repair endonuclease UvsE [Peribacillus alkalitolerans]
MTIFRLGYVAMSVHVQNASPSKTMTYSQFSKIKDREAAIHKLERIAKTNLHNCLRLLRHNLAHEITFFRFSSRLVPLANHPDLPDWDFLKPLKNELQAIKDFLQSRSDMRVDFHPDHFVLLNGTDIDILNTSIRTLRMHYSLLKGMGINTKHRCVMHVGGAYDDKEKALEQFILNWGLVPSKIQEMIMLENDDTTFTLNETLYLCEKLGVPLVFDYHHHLANKGNEEQWETQWDRIVSTWQQSQLPLKMHISSPRSDKDFLAHADYVDVDMFWSFVEKVKGTVPQIDCMIEAKQKDDALFRLMEELSAKKEIKKVNDSSFIVI